MSGTARVERMLAAAIPALLIAGGVTAFAQRHHTDTSAPAVRSAELPGDATPSKATPTATPAGRPSGANPPPSTDVGGTSPTVPPQTSVTPPANSAPLATVPSVAPAPGQPTATAPGTYTYTIVTSGGSGGSGASSASGGSGASGASGGSGASSASGGERTTSQTMTEHVVTTGSSGGVTRQQVTDSEPQQSSSQPPAGGLQDNGVQQVTFGAQGNLQVETDVTAAGQTIHCVWSPSILELPAGLKVGRDWTFGGSCSFSALGQQGTVHISGQGAVTGAQVVRVGTDDVPVWVISDSYTVVVRVPSLGVTFTLHHSAIDRVSGRLGLIIAEDATDTFTMGSRSSTAVSHQTLHSIRPS